MGYINLGVASTLISVSDPQGYGVCESLFLGRVVDSPSGSPLFTFPTFPQVYSFIDIPLKNDKQPGGPRGVCVAWTNTRLPDSLLRSASLVSSSSSLISYKYLSWRIILRKRKCASQRAACRYFVTGVLLPSWQQSASWSPAELEDGVRRVGLVIWLSGHVPDNFLGNQKASKLSLWLSPGHL